MTAGKYLARKAYNKWTRVATQLGRRRRGSIGRIEPIFAMGLHAPDSRVVLSSACLYAIQADEEGEFIYSHNLLSSQSVDRRCIDDNAEGHALRVRQKDLPGHQSL